MTFHTSHVGRLRLDDHTITVPLTADARDPRTIDVFARVVTRPGGESLPHLLFLQGGPGVESPRPSLDPASPSWLETALERYRVVFLDQRGTGRSTPVGDDLIASLGASGAAEYLTHLRADGIVRDAEALRELLGIGRWHTLGQSFGGFTTLHYLSVHPDSIERAYFTGGLSAVGRHCDDVYALCYAKVAAASEAYYRRFPEHRGVVARLVDRAAAGEIVLPSGEVVSPSRLRSLGHCLGSDDGWLALHSLLELDPRSLAFRYDLADLLPFGGRNPLYYVIHESSYADGVVTDWSAERTEPEAFKADPTWLTGEHVRREWLETVPALAPWKDVALKIAQVEWPRLYDADALADSDARGAAAVYANDCYVPLEYSLETGALLPGVHRYVTSEHEHSGLRSSGGKVLAHLFDLADGGRVR
ncbi:alpha/beta fold hydrolase [Rarobacter faecitabidus]|nr:alpha/beta fold hydrolase [Rarobacter faecitabidus]